MRQAAAWQARSRSPAVQQGGTDHLGAIVEIVGVSAVLVVWYVLWQALPAFTHQVGAICYTRVACIQVPCASKKGGAMLCPRSVVGPNYTSSLPLVSTWFHLGMQVCQ